MQRFSLAVFVGAAIATIPILVPQPAKAWGKFGHLTICEVAYRNLTPASRAEIGKILQSRSGGLTVPGRGQTAARNYRAFNYGCLEEDELPRRNPDDHFVNLPRSLKAIADGTCPPDVADGRCILNGIRRNLDVLRDPARSRTDRAFALFELGHFMGDLHQPLHVSFADDKGGNSIDAKVTGGCGKFGYRADNLHGVWDNCILHSGTFGRVYRRADYNPRWSRFTVIFRAADTLQANTSLAEEQRIVAGEPWQWAQESFAIALDPATRYCLAATELCRYSETAERYRRNSTKRMEQLDQAYLARYDRVVEDRVRFAGFRLAHLLNQALDPSYTGPRRDGAQPE